MAIKSGPVYVSVVSLVAGVTGSVVALTMLGFAASVSGSTPVQPSTYLTFVTNTSAIIWAAAVLFLIIFTVINSTACCRGDNTCGMSAGSRCRNIAFIIMAAACIVLAVVMNVYAMNERSQFNTCFQCPSCQSQNWGLSTFGDDLECTNPPADNLNCNCYSTAIFATYDTCYCALTSAAQSKGGVNQGTTCPGKAPGTYSCAVYTEDAYFESTTGAVVCSSIVALIAILVVIMGSIGTCMPDKRVANPLVQRNPGGQATIPVARAVQPGMAPQQLYTYQTQAQYGAPSQQPQYGAPPMAAAPAMAPSYVLPPQPSYAPTTTATTAAATATGAGYMATAPPSTDEPPTESTDGKVIMQ